MRFKKPKTFDRWRLEKEHQVIGRRGQQSLEPGYVLAPYIPIHINVEEFQPRQGIISRYATRMINRNLYGEINIQNLDN